jgi:4-amino-4-deoxy-L-arabinose transferase-like glycosyltransferase
VGIQTFPAPAEEQEQDKVGRLHLTPSSIAVIFVIALTAGSGLRLWRLGISPAWQWDEAVYWRVSASVQQGVLAEHSVYGLPWEPFLYQPPVYFLVVAQWFNLIGASIFHARLLGIIWTVGMQIVLFRLLWRIHGPRLAATAILPIIFDGWLLYIERVSYIENALMMLIVTAFLLYQRALDQPSWQRFAVAGLAVGAAGSFKQTGAYVLVSVLLCWLISSKEHRGHFILLGSAAIVIAAYLFTMVRMYDLRGHPWFIDQSLVQVKRVLGLQKSGGTLTTPGGALHLLTAQYRYFVPSLMLGATALVIALRRTWQCYRARNWSPAQPNALLYAWLATGVVIFGFSSLKFPQYFVLILMPAYCYLWTELARWDLRLTVKRAAVVIAVITGIGSFLLTVPTFSANSLGEIQTYAAHQIPAHAIVVTEQSIGDLIQQQWCTVEKADACVGHATYAITWKTYLQSSFDLGDASFQQLMKGATPIRSFSGPVGTATVWKLSKP